MCLNLSSKTFQTLLSSEEGNCVNQHQHCDFEESLCLWNQDIHDDFDWTFRHGRTSSDATGPAVDHTLISSNSR